MCPVFRERLVVHKPTLTMLHDAMGIEGGTPRVTLTDYPRTGFKGRYVARNADGRHRLSLSRKLPVREADFVLCHELTHALQVQRLGGVKEFVREWTREMREVGITTSVLRSGSFDLATYNSTPLEAEAIEGMHRWFPLCEELGFVVRMELR